MATMAAMAAMAARAAAAAPSPPTRATATAAAAEASKAVFCSKGLLCPPPAPSALVIRFNGRFPLGRLPWGALPVILTSSLDLPPANRGFYAVSAKKAARSGSLFPVGSMHGCGQITFPPAWLLFCRLSPAGGRVFIPASGYCRRLSNWKCPPDSNPSRVRRDRSEAPFHSPEAP